MMNVKQCTKCGEWFPATTDWFYTNKSCKFGLATVCKDCRRAHGRQRWQNPVTKEQQRKYRQNPTVKERERDYKRQHYQDPAVREQVRERKRKYRQNPAVIERQREYQRQYQQSPANKERAQEQQRQHYQDPAVRERKREYRQDPTVKEREREYQREYRQNPAKKEQLREYKRQRRQDPAVQEQERLTRHRRRARKHALPDNLTLTDVHHMMEYWHGCCAVCGRQLNDLFGTHTAADDHWIAIADPRPDNPGTVAINIIPLCHGIDGCNNHKLNRDPIEWLIETYGKRKAKQIQQRIEAYFEWVRQQDEKDQTA